MPRLRPSRLVTRREDAGVHGNGCRWRGRGHHACRPVRAAGQGRRLEAEADLGRPPRAVSDGKWLAYASTESGALEVYVESFPKPGSRQKVSTAGGREPTWAPGGDELFFMGRLCLGDRGDQLVLLRRPFREGSPPTIGRPRSFAEVSNPTLCSPNRCYDIAPDGRRFLVTLETATGFNTVFTDARDPRRPQLVRGAEGEGARQVDTPFDSPRSRLAQGEPARIQAGSGQGTRACRYSPSHSGFVTPACLRITASSPTPMSPRWGFGMVTTSSPLP